MISWERLPEERWGRPTRRRFPRRRQVPSPPFSDMSASYWNRNESYSQGILQKVEFRQDPSQHWEGSDSTGERNQVSFWADSEEEQEFTRRCLRETRRPSRNVSTGCRTNTRKEEDKLTDKEQKCAKLDGARIDVLVVEAHRNSSSYSEGDDNSDDRDRGRRFHAAPEHAEVDL